MTTEVRNLTESWTNLTNLLSLANGQSYSIQNTGPRIVYINEQATAPDASATGHSMLPNGEPLQFLQGNNFNLYVRCIENGSRIAVTEAN